MNEVLPYNWKSMFLIRTHKNFEEEKIFLFEFIFQEVLGLNFRIDFEAIITDYHVSYNGKSIIFKDLFFSSVPVDYYNFSQFIPKDVSFIINKGRRVPVLFGTGNEEWTENGLLIMHDIFASVFFMLTRWEEYTLRKHTDEFGRFDESLALSVREGFLDLPVVNEVIELLKYKIQVMWPEIIFRDRAQRVFITHDIDLPFQLSSRYRMLRYGVSQIFKHGNGHHGLKVLGNIFAFPKLTIKDPLDHFDEFMDFSEKHGTKSIFYVKLKGTDKLDFNSYIHNGLLTNLVVKIKDRGHKLAIHPSFNSFLDKDLLEREVKSLSKIVSAPIKHSRQHFLRFDVPLTFKLLDDLEIEFDSSMYYSKNGAFRTGCCFEHPIFNFIERKKLRLRERPVSLMDSTMMFKYGKDQNAMLLKAKNILGHVKYHRGDIVILWHNHLFNGYENLYKRIVDFAFS